MKQARCEEAPTISNFQRMKADLEGLSKQENASRKQEMTAKVQEMKVRLGDRLIVNPTGQRATTKALEEFLEREIQSLQVPPGNKGL